MQALLTFIALLLMALVTGVSFSHLLQRGRDRWHTLHTVRLILSLLGLSALITLALQLA